MTVTEPRHFFSAIPGEARVDEPNRVIRRVSLISEGDAKGHKDDEGRQVIVDQTCLDQIFQYCQSVGSVKVKVDHGSGVFSTAGYVDSFSREPERVTGNLHIYETEDEAPRIFEIARTNPRHMGISLEFLGDDEIAGKKVLARCSEVMTAALVSDPAANRSLFFAAKLSSLKTEKVLADTLKTDITPTIPKPDMAKKLDALQPEPKKVAPGTTPEPEQQVEPSPTLESIAEKLEKLSSDYGEFRKAYDTANPPMKDEDVNGEGTEGGDIKTGDDPKVKVDGKGKNVLETEKGEADEMEADVEKEEKKLARIVELTVKKLSASLGIKLPAGGNPQAAKTETDLEKATKSFESEVKRHDGDSAEALKTFSRINPTGYKLWRDNGQPGLGKKAA